MSFIFASATPRSAFGTGGTNQSPTLQTEATPNAPRITTLRSHANQFEEVDGGFMGCGGVEALMNTLHAHPFLPYFLQQCQCGRLS